MVELRPMTDAEYADFLAYVVPDYANEHVQAGDWPAEGAVERSAAEFNSLLLSGIATPGHHLFTIYDPDLQAGVGMIWFAEREIGGKRVAFVYNLLVDQAYCRHFWPWKPRCARSAWPIFACMCLATTRARRRFTQNSATW